MKRFSLLISIITFCVVSVYGNLSYAENWPTYRHDSSRSGISKEKFSTPLSLQWVFTPTFGPSHAWGDPQPKPVEGNLELPRVRFDDTFHVIISNGTVFFGSSSDNKIYALDSGTGHVRWEFYTDGPVRLAPTAWNNLVYAGSDDGTVYCLNAEKGTLVWSFQAAPSKEKILGNGRMISVWPVRTGVLVENGIAYFGAGVFPAEGLYLYALNARTGKLVWKNDSYGLGGRGTVSPQGYIMASSDKLFVPSGRSMPAAFSRKSGAFLFHRNFNWRSIGLFGGAFSLLSGDLLFNGTEQMLCVSEKNGALNFTLDIKKMASSNDSIFVLTGKKIAGYKRKTWIDATQKLYNLQKEIKRQVSTVKNLRASSKKDTKLTKKYKSALAKFNILSAIKKQLQDGIKKDTIFSTSCNLADAIISTAGMTFAGGKNVVKGFSTKTGKNVWSATIEGNANDLAAGSGNLYVSTDKGKIYCFTQGKQGAGKKISPVVVSNPFPRDKLTLIIQQLAESILEESGIERGYCLLLGDDDGRLAFNLSKLTDDLIIYSVIPDPAKANGTRKALSKGGVYGQKVIVVQTPPGELFYSDYFANLVLCDNKYIAGPSAISPEELYRMLKPCGGTAFVGRPWNDPSIPNQGSNVQQWVDSLKSNIADLGEDKTTKIKKIGLTTKIIRGPLPGAGSWTEEYANPGNTTCSDDTAIKGPIGILWYGLPGPAEIPSRHASNVSPLAFGGRMFIQGENLVMAYDSYNGLELWKRKIPGALRTNMKLDTGNLASDKKSLFMAIGRMCLRLDAATGKTVQTYIMPQSINAAGRQWGYISVLDGVLLGTATRKNIIAGVLFALDVKTGKTLWTHPGKTIMHTTICAGDGRVFFVDKSTTKKQKKQGLAGIKPQKRLDRFGKPVPPDVRLVVALDLKSGSIIWESPQYVSDCVKIGRSGGELMAMYKNGILLLCGQPWNGHFWSEFFSGAFSRRSLIALSAVDGKFLWSGRKGYRSRPLIVGDKIIAEPWAHDLKTGKEEQRINPITGEESKWQISRPGHHCGCIAASPNALFYRSAVTAYYDLLQDYGTIHFGAQRTGCWINCIPANGVVLTPEASSGCICPFSVQCSIVFKPRNVNRVWGVYSAEGALTPVKDLSINFGAPGDRKDSNGTLYLAYPRPGSGRLILSLKLGTRFLPGGKFYSGNPDFISVPGSPCPWIYASGIKGFSSCTFPITSAGQPPGKYTVRLHFWENPAAKPGDNIFDIKIQGQTAVKNFDPAKESGKTGKAVIREIRDVLVHGKLKVEMIPKSAGANPFLNGIEIIRTSILSVSMAMDKILLSNFQKGNRQTISVKVISDTYVYRMNPGTNYNDSSTLFVDGGNNSMNDSGHSIAFLKFPLGNIPGKILSAKLRIRTSSRDYAQSNDAGVIQVVETGFNGKTITYNKQPELGKRIGRIGKVSRNSPGEYNLLIDLNGRKELCIALVPTSTDGAFFDSLESTNPPELFITFGPKE